MPKTWAQYCYLSKDPNDLDFDHMVTIDDDSGVLGYVGPIIGCPDNDSQEISAWVCQEEREHYYGMLQLWKPIQLLGNTCSISWDDTLQWNFNYYKEREPDSAYPFHQLLATFIDREITLSDYEKWMHSSYDTLDLSAGSYTMTQDGVYGHAQAAQRMLDMWLRVEQEKSDHNVLQRLSCFAVTSPMAESLALDNPQEFRYASLCRLLTVRIIVQNPELEGWRLALADPDFQRLYLLESPRPLEFKISLEMFENWLRLKDAATHLQIDIPTSPQQLVQAESSIPSVIDPQLLRRSAAVSSCAKGDVAVQEILQAETPPRGHHRVEQKARKSGGGERPQQRMETRGVTPEVRAERAAFAQEYAERLRSSICTRAACKLAQIAAAAAAGIHDSTDCCRSDSSSSNSSSNNSSGQSSSSSSDSSRSSSRSSRSTSRSNKRFKGV